MMPMDYGRNKKIHGFLKKSHNCNPCAQHSNTCPRGLKMKRERGNPHRFPPHPPFLAIYGGCGQQNLWAITKRKPQPVGWGFVFGKTSRGSNRARAKREKRADGTFWCPRACRGAAPLLTLVAPANDPLFGGMRRLDTCIRQRRCGMMEKTKAGGGHDTARQ